MTSSNSFGLLVGLGVLRESRKAQISDDLREAKEKERTERIWEIGYEKKDLTRLN